MADGTGKAGPQAGRGIIMLALATAGAGATALTVWGWLQFGESIYLTRLTAFVANCF